MDKKIIAYIAPEIPALSATFVYNEILELEKKDFDIVPISVHVPEAKALESPARALANKTYHLYEKSFWHLFINTLLMIKAYPIRYLKTLLMVLFDVIRVGKLNRISIGIIYRFFVASTVAKVLITHKCKHIHAHFAHIPTDIAMYASLLSDIPFSFTAHANDIFDNGWLLKEKVSRSTFTIAISRFNYNFLVQKGAPAEKIHVVHCGVDPASFSSRGEKELSKPLRLGTLGRMVEKKGFDILIDACKLFKESGRSFVMEIAGDGPLKEELRMQVYTLGLTNEVIFLGPLSHSKVSAWIKELDIFMLSCKKDKHGDMDGIPVVLMEAMLSGIPVISTKLTGIPELIEDNTTGCLALPEDPLGLVLATERIISDKLFRKTICKNAIDTVNAEFDLSKNTLKIASLFLRSIGENHD